MINSISFGKPSLPSFFKPVYLNSVDSTNTAAKRLASQGEPEGAIIVANKQTAGRGRGDRKWFSPRGNLYTSTIFRPSCEIQKAAQLSFVGALAVYDMLLQYTASSRISIKWPNDVLIDGGKISGILLESSVDELRSGIWVVVGIGVNIASSPQVENNRTVALNDMVGKEVAINDSLVGLLTRLEFWYKRWRIDGFAPVRDAWLERHNPKSTSLMIRLPSEELNGEFLDLDLEGALVVKLPSMRIRRIAAGEIFISEKEKSAKCC